MLGSARGFTLVETLLALAILAVGIVGMLEIRANAVCNAGQSRNERVATMLAGRLLAEVALSPPDAGTVRREFTDFPGFHYRFVTEQELAEPLGPLKKLTIEVSYPTTFGEAAEEHVFSLETLVGLERSAEP